MLLETVKNLCPHCGEVIELVIDTSLPEQSYIEDCQVCCCPFLIVVNVEGEDLYVEVQADT